MSAGTAVSVITNSFVISTLPVKTYYQHDIIFRPEADNPTKRQRLVHALQTTVYPNVFNPRGVYDGQRLLYASHVVPTGTYRVHGSNPNAKPNAPGWYDIQIMRTAGEEINPTQVNQLMLRGRATPQTATATNLLQLLLRQSANQASPNNGRAYFTPEGKMALRGMAVELWRGFYQSVRPTVGKMLVTVDTTVAAMYMSGPMLEVAMAVLDTRDARHLNLRHENDPNYKKLERHFKNRLITVQTTGGRTKTIRSFVRAPVGGFEFQPSGSGPTTTVGAHYKQAHNITLKYPDSIGICTSGKNAPFKVVVPLELCTFLPGQLYKRKLPSEQTAAVVGFATMRPGERLQTIRGGTTKPGAAPRPGDLLSPVQEYERSEFIADAGMVVNQNTITVPGKLLRVPSLMYGQNQKIEPRDGSWNVLGKKFYKPTQLLNWGVVNFDRLRIGPQLVQKTIMDLVECCRKLGMNVNEPPPSAVLDGMGHNEERVLDAICNVFGGPQHVNMILVLLPAKADEIRTRVKYFCDVKLGVRSNCLRQNKVVGANSQYFNNVALKLNARLGGANLQVLSPALRELSHRPFMIMGADVGHPAPGMSRPSVTSLVWSHDLHATEYCATSHVQNPRMEIIADLKDMVKVALNMFGAKNKAPPERIFFYRDGVSEGEFAKVEVEEIQVIYEAFDELWTGMKLKAPKPKLTFTVVGKRHHVVFFPLSQNDAVSDRTGNCRAGLVVDQGLSNPQLPDFYLQSHSAIKGTSRSGHYTILKDENYGGDIAKLQELSFALCHVYSKATRSVSIPAPVYYADLVCARGKFHFDPELNMDLDGSASSVSGGGEAFDLDKWEPNYRATNPNIRASMYFL
ncbi:argonaute-like protein [Mycena sp. CBHHK59/15]|nr:argonaute-like protein [Mycena sp. CBHHK59/15]